MIVPVRMLAFNNPGTIRYVDIPDSEFEKATCEEAILNLTFLYGQNDMQPQKISSVSVGDVIEHEGHHIVRSLGFAPLTDEELADYEKIDRRERSWSEYARPSK